MDRFVIHGEPIGPTDLVMECSGCGVVGTVRLTRVSEAIVDHLAADHHADLPGYVLAEMAATLDDPQLGTFNFSHEPR